MRAGSELAALALLACAKIAAAEDINTESFTSTPALGAETFQLEPADVGKSGEWLATSAFSVARNPLTISTSQGTDRPVTTRALLELGGAFAFLHRFEAGVRVPLFQQRGDSPANTVFHVPAADGTALGDIGLHARVRLVRNDRLSVAVGLQLSLPTSRDGQFVGNPGPTARLRALVALRATPAITLTFNGGGVLRGDATYDNTGAVPGGAIAIAQGSGITWGGAVSLRALDHLRLSAEVFGDIVDAGPMQSWRNAGEALAGIRYELASGLAIGAAVGRGLTDAFGTPELRGVLSLAYAPSRAREVAPVLEDEQVPVAQPVKAPGKSDAVAADARDRCPFEDEDKDGFEDEDGCADPDNDGDAIRDAQDTCPDEAEVINGFKDNDGCPDEAGDKVVAVSGSMTPTQAAEQTFKQGRELMKQKQYAKACAAFEHSQRLDPQQGTQFNLAACYIEIGKLATAWTMYRELSRLDTNADRKAKASEAAKKLAPRVPKLLLSLATIPAGTNVFMNGADATALLNIETPVDFGTYELVAGAPAHKSWRKKVVIEEEGKVSKLTVTLEPTK